MNGRPEPGLLADTGALSRLMSFLKAGGEKMGG